VIEEEDDVLPLYRFLFSCYPRWVVVDEGLFFAMGGALNKRSFSIVWLVYGRPGG